MKKRVISGIIAAVLGVVTLCPVAASAADIRRIDVNGDKNVDVLDYTTLRKVISLNGQVDEDGTVLSYVRGDLNKDGKLTQEDLDILKPILDNQAVTEDTKAADVNEDGIIDVLDYGTVRRAIEKGGQIDKKGVVLEYRIGDLNNDHALDAKDLELLKQLI